ncbi:adenylyl-sulfate kinase [Desulforamulus ruminis]|uniref:Adenylyl-sulfate kinase n=1 Tax=Desulforamulus ruminis (strain ATCC 23193 / DSM 2154 / NCIMB 8452 / DL) TaxID=696281 RepID=F6DM51_DESRL|nr:adenylyl-sulfate kinase [Desulforamulus ruminis]AEG59393.1 adenylylsulfate kinase [Desulforamulus ruminis DSM 2154]
MFTIWLTGLSGAGKTTLSALLAEELCRKGYKLELLDGDQLRGGISRDLGYGKEDRIKQVQRVGYLCELLNKHGVVTIVSLISPYRDSREVLRTKIKHFVEVYMKCPLETLLGRDPKGLYKKALAGEIKSFTGISDPYEEPLRPEITVFSDQETPHQGCEKVLQRLLELELID